MEFLPGDIICENGTNWISRAIRWAEHAPGEDAVYANHVAMFTGPSDVTEALWKVVNRPAAVALAGVSYQVWRHTGLTDSQRRAVAAQALSYVGRDYGVGKIMLHFGDALLTKTTGKEIYAFRRMAGVDKYPICSWVVAESYNKALKMQLGPPPSEAAPDDIWRYMRARPAIWKRLCDIKA